MMDGVVPYPPELAARYRERGYWEDRSLASHFDEASARYAERVAFVAGGERATYAELGERIERVALHLLKLGIAPLQTMVMQLPNVPAFLYLYFALQKVGAIPLMALPPHRHHEISSFVQATDAVGLAVPERMGEFDFLELAQRLRREYSSLRHVFVHGENVPAGCHSLARLAREDSGLGREALAAVRIEPTDPAVFQLSGGTTGVPKIIPRTHNDYVYNSKASAAVIDIRPDDALLVILPIAHNFPLASPGIQGFLLAGARLVLSTSTRASDVFALIEREQVTHLELVPALLIRYLDDPALRQHDL